MANLLITPSIVRITLLMFGCANGKKAMSPPPETKISNFRSLLHQVVHAAALVRFGEHEWQPFTLEQPREDGHGDFATNFAMTQAGVLRQAPHKIAVSLQEELEKNTLLADIEIAGPGFVNLTLSPNGWQTMWHLVADRATKGYPVDAGMGKVLVEYVSANPTGPLHVGHGRGAAVGDSLVRLLRRTGSTVEAEYYVNDAGLQIEILGRSVLARALQAEGTTIDFPEEGYQGEYIRELAGQWRAAGSPGEGDERTVGRWAGENIRDGIAKDLGAFRVQFDRWFSEYSLYDDGSVDKALERLSATGNTYEKEGALWFRSSDFDDEKDRVLIRSNGVKTYFASDIAYHINKFERGFDLAIDLWGADHHGYIPRVRAAMQALGYDDSRFRVQLIQFVSLLRDGQPVQMSTRGGTFETLADLVQEAGADAGRYYYLLRKPDSHLEFDLALARRQTNENPVYYVMYGHARIATLLRKAGALPTDIPVPEELHPSEARLLCLLDRYPVVLAEAAVLLSPHLVVGALQSMAAAFHKFYTDCPILGSADPVRAYRLHLCRWTQTALADGLQLVGVEPPDSM